MGGNAKLKIAVFKVVMMGLDKTETKTKQNKTTKMQIIPKYI